MDDEIQPSPDQTGAEGCRWPELSNAMVRLYKELFGRGDEGPSGLRHARPRDLDAREQPHAGRDADTSAGRAPAAQGHQDVLPARQRARGRRGGRADHRAPRARVRQRHRHQQDVSSEVFYGATRGPPRAWRRARGGCASAVTSGGAMCVTSSRSRSCSTSRSSAIRHIQARPSSCDHVTTTRPPVRSRKRWISRISRQSSTTTSRGRTTPAR